MRAKKGAVAICIGLFLSASLLPAITGDTLSAKDSETVVHYHFDPPRLKKSAGGSIEIAMPGLDNIQSPGIPRVPVQPACVLLPHNTKVANIAVQPGGKHLLGDGYTVETGHPVVSPGPGGHPADASHATTVSKPHIQKYPGSMFEKVGVQCFRGYRMLILRLYPVHYHPASGTVWYYDSMMVTVTCDEAHHPSPLYRGLHRDRQQIRHMVDNPDMLQSYMQHPEQEAASTITASAPSSRYVIVTSRRFLNESQPTPFQSFLEYKQRHNVSAAVVTVEGIVNQSAYWHDDPLFNDTQAKIRRFIRDAYRTWNTDYVLLAGDADTATPDEDIVPARRLYAKTGGLPLSTSGQGGHVPSDIYYACLDGTFNADGDQRWGENASNNDVADEDEADLYAEVWVGRACIDSAGEMANFVNKTIAYSETGQDPYLGDILLVGEYLGFGGVAQYGGNYKDEITPLIPEEYTIHTLYDRDRPADWSTRDLTAFMDEGVHIINHDGHGWTSRAMRMSTFDISQLDNPDPFFLYSQTCLAGSFDNWYPEDNYYTSDCVAEYFTVETPHGAFAAIMNSRYGLGMEDSLDSPSQRYDLAFFDALYNQDVRELGRANHASKEANIYRIDEPGMRWVFYETNLLGDPQLAVQPVEPFDVNLTLDIQTPAPHGLYIGGRRLFSVPLMRTPLVFGNVTVSAMAHSEPAGMVERVEFRIDGDVVQSDHTPPYRWNWDASIAGRHTVNVTAYGAFNSKASSEMPVRIFNYNR